MARGPFRSVWCVLCLLLAEVAIGTYAQQLSGDSPNVVLLFADDLGYGDVGFNGMPTIATPNLDAMAAGGKRLTSWYSGAAVCSPSRASLLTGREFVRSGIYPGVLGCDATNGLPLNETLLPELLQARGYSTMAIGKWHLGQREEFLPTRRGFDSYYGVPYSVDMGSLEQGPCIDPECPYLPLMENETVLEQPTDLFKLSTRYAEQAVSFVKQQAAAKKPFFLYLAFSHVHVSIPFLPQYAGPRFNGTQPRGPFGDALAELDWVAGEVMEAIKAAGVQDNTLVVFTSDNGPWRIERLNGGSPGQFTGLYATVHYNYTDTGKGSTWEGGIREPAFALWPGRISPNTHTSAAVSSMDVFTTIASLAGATLPSAPIDGRDISAVLFNDTAPSPHDFLFFWRTRSPVDLSAVRHGPYKLHFITQSGYGLDPPITHSPPLIFNVDEDPSEQYALDPKDHKDLIALVTAARDSHKRSVHMYPSQTGAQNLSYAVCQQTNRKQCFWPN